IHSILVSTQFLLENILSDFSFFKNYSFLKIIEPGTRQLSLMGLKKFHKVQDILLPTQSDTETYHEVARKTEELMGSLVFYNPIKKVFIDLSQVAKLETKTNEEYTVQYQSA
ncbi:MAG: hypothetical protein D6767_02170, partial [Candidatus Hydrogenedentota bacterium]